MAPKFRKTLAAKLATHAPTFGLSEVAFPSFELQHGWSRVRMVPQGSESIGHGSLTCFLGPHPVSEP